MDPIVIPIALALSGTTLMAVAVFNERRMHRHRQPGVSYSAATFRRDGGWRRVDLFTEEGLRYQRRASGFGVPAAMFWVLALIAYVIVR